MTLLELLEEDHKDIMLALIPNIKILIEKFCNETALGKLPDQPAGDKSPNTGMLQHSNTMGSKFIGSDFSSMNRKYEMGGGSKGFGGNYKKMPTMIPN